MFTCALNLLIPELYKTFNKMTTRLIRREKIRKAVKRKNLRYNKESINEHQTNSLKNYDSYDEMMKDIDKE